MAAVIVAEAALASMLRTCALAVDSSTMRAIIAVESGITPRGAGFVEIHPWAIGDNTTLKSYTSASYAQAVVLARRLIARGDNIDVGLAQVNSANFTGYRASAATMLEPCQNLVVASRILANAYVASSAVFSQPRAALWHAISAYNTGSLYAGARYVNAVVAEAARRPLVPSIDLLTVGSVAAPIQEARQHATSRPMLVVRASLTPHMPRANYAVVVADSRTLAVKLPLSNSEATRK